MSAPREPNARQLAAHDAAQARGDQGYLDPETGLFVLTAQKLLARGRCCGNGCRHCPYDAVERRRAGRPGA